MSFIILFSGISIVWKSDTCVSFPGSGCESIPVPGLLSYGMLGLLAGPSARLRSLVQQKTDHLLDGLDTALITVILGRFFSSLDLVQSSRKVEPGKCSSHRKVNTWSCLLYH